MDSNLARTADRFLQDPSDARAFAVLEEHHFLHGEWPELVRLYERRLDAPDLQSDPRARARTCFRLGQVLEERCLQVDRAVERYQEAARLAPDLRPALQQLRRIYAGREAWDLVLQVAELEAGLPMQPFEQAAFSAQMGEIWHRHMGDAEQALLHFERALEADPGRIEALRGLARLREEQGDAAGAADALERVVERVKGPERSRPLAALAELYQNALGQAERAEELFRRALECDPRCEDALAALTELATQREHWIEACDLLAQRFHLVIGATRRLAIAHEAGRIALVQLRDPQAARLWYKRALELFPSEPTVMLALADVERLAGKRDALASWLERAILASPEAVPVDALLESADLSAAAGDARRALETVGLALSREPDHEGALDRQTRLLEQLGLGAELTRSLEQQAEAAAHEPERAAALWTRIAGIHLADPGDEPAAIAAYERALVAKPDAPEAVDSLASLHEAGERWEGLRTLLEQAAEAASGRRSLALQTRLGELLLARFDEPEAAQTAFQTALEADPSDPRALQGLERVALASGDEDAILEAFEREAAVTTDRARLGFLVWELVRILETRDQPDEALLWIERLVQVAPEERDVLDTCSRLQEQLGHDEELVGTLERLDVLLVGTDQAANRRRLAEIHAKRGDVAATIDSYRSALQADPEDLASLRALLEPLERTGHWRELADVHAALAERVAGDDRCRHLNARAELLEGSLGDPHGAIAALERLGEAGAGGAELENRIAALLDGAGRHEELATRLARRLEGAEAGDASLELRLSELLVESLGRASEAVPYLERLESREDLENAERERTLRTLDQALRRSGDAEALVLFLERRARAAGDADAAAQLDLERAGLVCELGRPEQARTLYEALADGPSPVAAEAETRLEELLERSGAWDVLCRRLEARLPADSDKAGADLLERIAALRRDRLGDRTGAIESLEAASELAPDRPALWQALARLYAEDDRHEDLLRALEAEIETGADPKRSHLLHARAAELCRGPLGSPERATPHFRAVLEFDSSNWGASEFLMTQLEAEENWAELAAVLHARLDHPGDGPENAEATTALRLRLAALHSGALEDPEAAIGLLEPAFDVPESLPLVAEPLADLLQRAGRSEDLIAVCRRSVAALREPSERAPWSLRLGDALRAADRLGEAADAYRQVLADRTGDRDAERALREVYRALGESQPLARLLEAELHGVAGADEIPIRQELAQLFASCLERPADALMHLRRVIDIDPGRGEAVGRALELARDLGAHAEQLELLDVALLRTPGPSQRTALMAERARLLTGPLDRRDEAVGAFQSALRADPANRELLRELRALLEERGDSDGALQTLEAEAALLPTTERGALYEEAARRAEDEGPDAVLPWLARMRAVRPGDSDVLARLVSVQRHRDDPIALAVALAEQIEAEPDAGHRVTLRRELAALYEERLEAPGRGLAVLEAARVDAPGDAALLEALGERYAATGRARERAEVLEARIRCAAGGTPELRRELARVQNRELAEPGNAADTLWALLTAPKTRGVLRIEVLRELGEALRATGRTDLWAQSAEEELRSLQHGDGVFDERRHELRRELAEAYEGELAEPDAALPHWRALVDAATDADDPATFLRAEERLLAGLRRTRNASELSRRIEARLERDADAPDLWLELARLYEERLHRPSSAAEAFREVLCREPASLDALRGVRRVCQRLGRPDQVAETLETELAMDVPRTAPESAALWRRLGEVSWRELDSTTRASRAFASALEADPEDLEALRSLQTLFEGMEDWRGALDLFESEVAVLDASEPERRHELWLRAGTMAWTRVDDPERALRCYEAAAEIETLPAARRYEWADLYEKVGNRERFAEVLADWCADEAATPDAREWLRLADVLEALDNPEEALERTERAVNTEPGHPEAWDALARRREAAGLSCETAEALEAAAGCRQGRQAADRLARAAALLSPADPARSAELLSRAVREDPAHGVAQAALAARSHELGRLTAARDAALCALDLSRTDSGAAEEDLLAALLCGADAARQVEDVDAARRLFQAALERQPEHPEALEGLARVLVAGEDWPAARNVLERLLALVSAAAEGVPDSGRADLEARLGAVLEATGDADEALGRYRTATELDPDLDVAHAGTARLLEQLGRTPEAVDALQRWALRTGENEPRADRLLHAAELEIGCDGREEPAESLLREATGLAPQRPQPWVLLARLLASGGRTSESLEAANRALAAVPTDAPERADLFQARGEALEKRGERTEAAHAFADAVAVDPMRTTAALAAARLLRASGEWRAASEGLEAFVASHPEAETEGLAEAWHQLGRLRAGPLEDVEGSIEAYRKALACDPALEEAREALAELLVHVPAEWDEAIARHGELLAHEPARLGSVRGLLRIARGRKCDDAVALGCGLLRALGAATPEERREAPAKLPLQALPGAELDDPTFEAARRVAVEAAREIGDALGTGAPTDLPARAGDPIARFRSELVAEEGRLSAAALVPLPDAEVGAMLGLVAQLSLDAESVQGDGQLVNDLSRQLGRRARRRIRKALGDMPADAIATLDVAAWRAELRALAAAQVLERTGIDLRPALVSRLGLPEADCRALPEEADLTGLVAECPETRALLRRIVEAWVPLLQV